jgi:hypothetical protein
MNPLTGDTSWRLHQTAVGIAKKPKFVGSKTTKMEAGWKKIGDEVGGWPFLSPWINWVSWPFYFSANDRIVRLFSL